MDEIKGNVMIEVTDSGSVNLHYPPAAIDYNFNILKDEVIEQLTEKGAVVLARLDGIDRAMTAALKEYAKIFVAIMTKYEAPQDDVHWKAGAQGYARFGKKMPDWNGRSDGY